jgi:hypothetical protein
MIEKRAGFTNIFWVAKRLKFTEYGQLFGATVHVAVKAINHRESRFSELLPRPFLQSRNGRFTNGGAENAAEHEYDQGDDDGETRSQAA